MSAPARHFRALLGGLVLAALSACAVYGGGYDGDVYVGGVYEAPGFVYGGWGPGYHVGPPRGVMRGGGRPMPSIPSRPRRR